MGSLRADVSVPSLPPPQPKSPPEYPDLYGKRRELAKVQILEREIGFLEEELKSMEGLQPASKSCKEVADFVIGNVDPLIPTTKKSSRSCPFWKWLCGLSCFNLSWICCCSCPTCPKKSCCCPDCCSICKCSGSCFSCRLPECHCFSCWNCKCLKKKKKKLKCSTNCCCCIPKCPSCSNVKCTCCCYPKCPKINLCSSSCHKNCCCCPCYFCC